MARILLPAPSEVIEQKVPFTFASGTVLLQAVPAGSIVDSAWVLVQQAFDGPAPSVTLGTTGSPGLVLGPGDVSPGVVDQYANLGVTQFAASDFLELVVSAAGATRGGGLLVYRFRS